MIQNRLLKQCFALIALHLICASVSGQHHGSFGETLSPGMTNSQGEEIVTAPAGFNALLNLDDRNLQTLVKQGSVSISIPQHLIGRVEAIVLRRPVVFKENKSIAFADAQLAGQQLIVDVDNSILGRIGYQPVQLNVYEPQFSSVVLKYVAGNAEDSEKNLGDAEQDSPLLKLTLKSGNGITGKIRGIQQLDLDSTLGKIAVKLSRVSKIQFRDRGLLNVQMTSGDLISGKLDEGKFVLISRWGTETIPLKDISEMTLGVVDRIADR